MAILQMRDETLSGKVLQEWSFECLTERISIRELIRGRVYQEVQDFNLKQPEYFRGLVQPTDAEQTLNGYRLRRRRPIEWKPQFEKAIAAFEANQILVLIDDHQAQSLDEEIAVCPTTQVAFLRLTLLVGG